MTLMRRAAVWVGVAVQLVQLAATAGPAQAQAPVVDAQCRAGTASERITQDACQKALDLFHFMAPQLGAMIVGGNAALGEHSTLRGLGHVSLGLRFNGLESRLPRVDERTPATTGAVASDYAVNRQWVAAPVVDAAVGIFRGIPLAGTYALGLDGLVNVAYVPSVDESDLSVDVPLGSFKFGFGARLGVLRETFATPGIVVTWLQRKLPSLSVQGRVDNDELNVRDIELSTTAWRVVAGKNLSLIGLAVGGGQDTYESAADVQVTVNRVVPSVESSVFAARQELTRTNVFGSVSVNLSAVRFVAEVGRASGGRLSTYNTFIDNRADDARSYASVGLRVSW